MMMSWRVPPTTDPEFLECSRARICIEIRNFVIGGATMRESQPVKRSRVAFQWFSTESGGFSFFYLFLLFFFSFWFFSNLRKFKVTEFYRNEFSLFSFLDPGDLLNFISSNKNFHREKSYSREKSPCNETVLFQNWNSLRSIYATRGMISIMKEKGGNKFSLISYKWKTIINYIIIQ